jgi:exopolysaccharide production protein ExoQ
LSDLSIFIGLLTLIVFLFVEYVLPSAQAPTPKDTGIDFIVALLLVGQIVRFYLFDTPRTDALAVLEGDFSVGNISTIVWTVLAALYFAFVLLKDRFQVGWFFCTPYRWISILLILYVLTAAWSIVPEFTLFRAGELVIWVGLLIYFFSRMDSILEATLFMALYGTIWLIMNVPTLFDNVSEGIIFSAVKDNFIPTLGFAVIVLGWATEYWLFFSIVGLCIFVVAGSAAAMPSALAAGFAGLIFNQTVAIRVVGYVGLLFTVSMIVLYLLAPDEFSEIAEYLAVFLQKPPEELLNATGRYAIWSLMWDFTKDNYFGSGFGSDRFIQLLGNTTEVSSRLGSSTVFIYSAHDAILSAWVAAGWLGVIALVFVYGSGVRYCSRPETPHRCSRTMVLVFMICNGVAVPGLAGVFSPSPPLWIVWIAVLAICPTGGARVDASINSI